MAWHDRPLAASMPPPVPFGVSLRTDYEYVENAVNIT